MPVSDLALLIADLNTYKSQLQKEVNAQASKLMTRGKTVAESHTPVDTGKLKSNWKQIQNGNQHTVYNDTEYAINQELGGVTPTGGVYSGHNMVENGANFVEKNINDMANDIAKTMLGGVLRGK